MVKNILVNITYNALAAERYKKSLEKFSLPLITQKVKLCEENTYAKFQNFKR